MVEKVKNSPDPCDGGKDRLQTLARRIWADVAKEEVVIEDLPSKLQSASPEQKEMFFEQWSVKVWNVKAVFAATNLSSKGAMSLRQFIKQCTVDFYRKLFAGQEKKSPEEFQA